jgi:hypothetical protein
MNRDIWVVVYNNNAEVWLLSQQLRSLIRLKNKMPYNIVINHNDEKARETEALFAKHKISELIGQAKFPIRIFYEDEIIPSQYSLANINGYANQQLIKLQVYKRSPCNEHIILDAKNIFLDLDPIKNYKPRNVSTPMISQHFIPCYETSLNRWHKGQKPKKIIPVLTPYLFKKSVLRALEEDFESTDEYFQWISQPFESTKLWRWHPYLFQNYHKTTFCLSEFVIYNLFEQTLPYYRKWWKRIPKQDKIGRICKTRKHLDATYLTKKSNIITLHRNLVEEIGIAFCEKHIQRYQQWCELE